MKDKIIGQIIAKSDKTAKISVVRYARNKLYGKQFKITKKYLTHNPSDIGNIGDTVELIPIRPISRNKHWQVSKIVKEK